MSVHSVAAPRSNSPTGSLDHTTLASRLLLLIAGHAVLGVWMSESESVALGHLLVTVGAGVFYCISKGTAAAAIEVALYIAGAEVLWRMTDGYLLWEQSKYLVIAFLALALTRVEVRSNQISRMATLIPVLLAPSCILTMQYTGIIDARKAIAFNLAGPVALAFACVVLSRCRMGDLDPHRILLAPLLPIVSVAAIAGFSTVTAESIRFGSQSMILTSGSYGPNQVSAVIGLGALFCLLAALTTNNKLFRGVLLTLFVLLTAQAVLTFSRGGVVSAALAAMAFVVHTISRTRLRVAAISTIAVAGVILGAWLLPALDDFTGGALTGRYTKLDVTDREKIAAGDLRLWRAHPILGVGPGMSARLRDFRTGQPAHTEFSRLLAEHGLMGLATILLVPAILLLAYRQAPTSLSKGWVAVMAVWAVMSMGHAATRLATVAIVFGLATVRWPAQKG